MTEPSADRKGNPLSGLRIDGCEGITSLDNDFINISKTDPDVLAWNEKTHAYEMRPRAYPRQHLRDAGFVHDGHGLWYAHRDQAVRDLPEWELIADPDTYARLHS